MSEKYCIPRYLLSKIFYMLPLPWSIKLLVILTARWVLLDKIIMLTDIILVTSLIYLICGYVFDV